MFSLFQLGLHRASHPVPCTDSWERLHVGLWHAKNAVIFEQNEYILFLIFEDQLLCQ